MTKIMLVEDDKSLREIYGVRLLAEGYDIVSAGDGEQALAMAIKERPHLIISDIMMPKISGFDLLDILRSTTETKNTKIIMMTALSSEDQRLRGEQLGADRYLVKSQVGIEDVVRVVHEVLGDGPQATAHQVPTPQPATQSANLNPAAAPPVAPTAPQPVAQPTPAPQPAQAPPMPRPMPQPTMPPARPPVQPTATGSTVPKPAQIKSRVIQPINDINDSQVDIKELLDKELAREAGIADNARPEVNSTADELADINQQIAAFSPASIEEEEKALEQIIRHGDESPAEAPQNPVQPTEQASAQPIAQPTEAAPVAPPQMPMPPNQSEPIAQSQPGQTPQDTTNPSPDSIPQPQPTGLPQPTNFSNPPQSND